MRLPSSAHYVSTRNFSRVCESSHPRGPHALRFTLPKGLQRGIYYLQTPYRSNGPTRSPRYSHWPISHSLYLVLTIAYNAHGDVASIRTISAVSYLLYAAMVLVTMWGLSTVVALLGFRKNHLIGVPLAVTSLLYTYCRIMSVSFASSRRQTFVVQKA